jgi:hypothetical protein
VNGVGFPRALARAPPVREENALDERNQADLQVKHWSEVRSPKEVNNRRYVFAEAYHLQVLIRTRKRLDSTFDYATIYLIGANIEWLQMIG